jgi:hypothetical protein
MASRAPSAVIPSAVLNLADDLDVPTADWYIASAESGRGPGALPELWNFDIPGSEAPERADEPHEDQAPAPEQG